MRFRTRDAIRKKLPANVPPTSFIAESNRLTNESAGIVEQSSTSQPVAYGHQFGTLSMHNAQAKLAVSEPDDPLEQEADHIADQVVTGNVSRQVAQAPQNETEHNAPAADSGFSADEALRAGSAPLNSLTRREMEPLFGHDFSQVRVHTDDTASQSARKVNALAYTVGNDIVFGAGRYAPGTQEGDRLLAHELTHVVQQSGAGGSASETNHSTLFRDFEVPPAPVTLDAPAEREKDSFPEADKERARATVIGPLRAAAARLGAGEKADVISVLRHLRPMRAAAAGVKWPESMFPDVQAAMDELDLNRTLLESLKLSDREAVARARGHWLEARSDLAAARKALDKSRPDLLKQPDAKERDGISNDINAVVALSAQIDATLKDLIKAPRTKEGFSTVEDTAGDLVHQFDTIAPPEAVQEMINAKDAFLKGMATIAPLALGKEESLKQAQADINNIANRLAALVGDAAPASDQGEPGKDDEEQNATTPPDPAPSPNALPPPPPPPPKSANGGQ